MALSICFLLLNKAIGTIMDKSDDTSFSSISKDPLPLFNVEICYVDYDIKKGSRDQNVKIGD